jgi:hypothetical protein
MLVESGAAGRFHDDGATSNPEDQVTQRVQHLGRRRPRKLARRLRRNRLDTTRQRAIPVPRQARLPDVARLFGVGHNDAGYPRHGYPACDEDMGGMARGGPSSMLATGHDLVMFGPPTLPVPAAVSPAGQSLARLIGQARHWRSAPVWRPKAVRLDALGYRRCHSGNAAAHGGGKTRPSQPSGATPDRSCMTHYCEIAERHHSYLQTSRRSLRSRTTRNRRAVRRTLISLGPKLDRRVSATVAITLRIFARGHVALF